LTEFPTEIAKTAIYMADWIKALKGYFVAM
jgi:hypothetical protein